MAFIAPFTSTVQVEAAGGDKSSNCVTKTPEMKTAWTAQSDYWQGINPAKNTPKSVLRKLSQDFRYEGMTKLGAKRLVMSFKAKGSAKITGAYACFENYVVEQLRNADGSLYFYADGSPALANRTVSSYWAPVDYRRMLVWNLKLKELTPKLGQKGTNLVAWVIGGS